VYNLNVAFVGQRISPLLNLIKGLEYNNEGMMGQIKLISNNFRGVLAKEIAYLD